MDFVHRQDVLQIEHPLPGVVRVAAFRKPLNQLLERPERLQRGARIVLRHVLGDEPIQNGASFHETHQALHVVGVVDVRMTRVELDEAIRGGDRRRRLVELVVCVDDIELRLHGERAERISDFELLVVLYRLFVIAAIQVTLGRVVEALRRPVRGRIMLLAQEAASRQRGGQQRKGDESHGRCHTRKINRISSPNPDMAVLARGHTQAEFLTQVRPRRFHAVARESPSPPAPLPRGEGREPAKSLPRSA